MSVQSGSQAGMLRYRIYATPNDSRKNFDGVVSVTKTTLTLSSVLNEEEEIFVGVCSVALIQYYRHSRHVTLMRGSSFLFDNAALTADIEDPSNNTPTSWSMVTLEFDTVEDCDEFTEALVERHAEKVSNPPVPIISTPRSEVSSRHSQSQSKRSYTSQQTPRSEANTKSNGGSVSPSQRDAATHNTSKLSANSRPVSSHVSETRSATKDHYNSHTPTQRTGATSPSGNSNRPASRRAVPESEATQSVVESVRSSNRLPSRRSSQAGDSPRSSALPSRREGDSGSAAPSASNRLPSRRSSQVGDSPRSSALPSRRSSQAGDSPRSSALPSRREGDSGSVASHSLRASQHQPVSASRSQGTSVAMSDVTGSKVSGSAVRSSSRRKELERPSEREFRADPTPSQSHASRRHESPRSEQKAASTAASQSKVSGSRRHESPRSEQKGLSATPSQASQSQSHHSPTRQALVESGAASRSSAQRKYSPSEFSSVSQSEPSRTRQAQQQDKSYRTESPYRSPQSSRSRSLRGSEQDGLFRNMMKLQHHRLHFMQYLHKEMVHQAYLAEESKVKAAAAVANGSRTRSRSRNGSRHSAGVSAEEAARLKEIENRLKEVEVLHREAEKERNDALRLRRDLEEGRSNQWNSVIFSDDVNNANNNRRASQYNAASNNGQLIIAQPAGGAGGVLTIPSAQPQQLAAYLAMPPDDADMAKAIVDRYVFGDEWDRIYPRYESDVRFNAQMDICLALKLPRRLVTVTNLVVDQPGLRVTAEIRHDRNRMERDVVERRMNGCPFRFLQRFYDMRDILDADGTGAGSRTQQQQRRSSRGASRRAGRRGSRYDEDDSSVFGDEYDNLDMRRNELKRQVDDRVKDAEKRLGKKKDKLRSDVARQVRQNLLDLEEEEEYSRDRVVLDEATSRRNMMKNGTNKLVTSSQDLEQLEVQRRAEIEVGASRQLQAIMAARRRQYAVLQITEAERQRRKAIEGQERLIRGSLNETMNPGATADLYYKLEAAERAHREAVVNAERKARNNMLAHVRNFVNNVVREQLNNLIANEAAERAAIRSESMLDWLAIVAGSGSSSRGRGAGARSRQLEDRTFAEIAADLADEETENRRLLEDEERNRRLFYRKEAIHVEEEIDRADLENDEADARDAILNEMLDQNRNQLERRINEREQLAGLVSEEAFYRKSIEQDEQDAFDIILELFAQELKDLLARPVDEDSDESPRRRRMSTQRTAKPFHYLTFSPEDMDYAPSAVLALEGMLGCAINKNLEVVSISKPLPKVTDDDLQFQAGDMILDVAGHSLHSVSHLREVLSNRAMQIQEEAFAEFPDVPDDELTTNPALQKYLEVLCEHHNYLVQVLRVCDIYQIIVKS